MGLKEIVEPKIQIQKSESVNKTETLPQNGTIQCIAMIAMIAK